MGRKRLRCLFIQMIKKITEGNYRKYGTLLLRAKHGRLIRSLHWKTQMLKLKKKRFQIWQHINSILPKEISSSSKMSESYICKNDLALIGIVQKNASRQSTFSLSFTRQQANLDSAPPPTRHASALGVFESAILSAWNLHTTDN